MSVATAALQQRLHDRVRDADTLLRDWEKDGYKGGDVDKGKARVGRLRPS